MRIDKLRSEIGNKERKELDLIRFINTCNEGNPNYCLLLGAGCSVTSNIRPAQELIDLWKKEICINDYSKEFDEDNYDPIKATSFLKEKCSSWYDSRNEYASLFEKRFDLPRQRRIFIEKEVSEKMPSLGYAYLINLVRAGYFNTIFTTNFDDLLNEAFYIFSEQRPITCAHDSAIGSITITSRRPKIIKLHGDYLFDDIKSTLRETESLENNMRDKFIEFSKDYGLIVIGYSGSDRSIMDVLFHLLKSDVYFKNGIYWCIRKNDDINPDLRKLLWRDRVYYVEIDGFDEFLGKLNFYLNSNRLPIESSIVSNKANEIIKGILSNQFLRKSSSEIIKTDINKLKEQKTKDLFREIISSLESENEVGEESKSLTSKTKLERKGESLSVAERIELFQLSEKLLISKYDDVINEIDTILINGKDISIKFNIELLKIKAKCFFNSGYRNKAIGYYLGIEKIEGPSLSTYSSLINLTEDHKKKLEYIDRMLELDKYYYRPYYFKAKLLIAEYESCIDKEKCPSRDDILKLIDDGIEKDPSLNSPCWELKFNFILSEKNNDNKLELCSQIVEKLKLQDPYDLSVLSMETELMKEQKIENEEILSHANSIKERSSFKNKVHYDLFILDLLDELNLKDKIKTQLREIEEKYDINADYLNTKARIILQKFDELDQAIEVLKNSLSLEVEQNTLKRLCRYYIYKGMHEEAKDIIFNKLGVDNEEELIIYYESQNDFDSALEITRKHLEKRPLDRGLIVRESYLLLMKNDFKAAYDYTRQYLEFSNFSEPVLIINHEIASAKLKNKIKEDRLDRANLDNDNMIKAAVAILKHDKVSCYNYIEKELEKNQERKYTFKNWIVFESIRNEPRFKAYFHNSEPSGVLQTG